MTPAVKSRRKENTDDFPCKARPDDPAAHGEDIGVIVAAAIFGREHIVAQRSPDAMDLIGSNTDTDAGTADKDASVKRTVFNGLCNLFGNDRIVTPFRCMCAIVGIGNPLFVQVLLDVFLQIKTTVVGTNY